MARITKAYIEGRARLVNRILKSRGKSVVLGRAYGRWQLYLAKGTELKRSGGYEKQLMTGTISDLDRFLDGMIAMYDATRRK